MAQVDTKLYPQAPLWSGVDRIAQQVQDAADRFVVEAERVTLDKTRTDEWRAEALGKLRQDATTSIIGMGRDGLAEAGRVRARILAERNAALDAGDKSTDWSKLGVLQAEYGAHLATFTDNTLAGSYRAQEVRALYDRLAGRADHLRALRAASKPELANLAVNSDLADPNGQVARDLLRRFERDEADAGGASATDEQIAATQEAVTRLSQAVARAEAAIDPQASQNVIAGQSWWLRVTGEAGRNTFGYLPEGGVEPRIEGGKLIFGG